MNVQNENIFAWQKFQIFFGVLDNTDFLAANGRCWAQFYVWRKSESTPPPSHPHHHTHSPWVTVYDEKLLARWSVIADWVISGDFIEYAAC